MKPLHVTIALLCGACLQSAAADALPRYKVEALKTPDPYEYRVTGFNNHGQVVGYSVTPREDRYVSYLWSAGRVQRLADATGGGWGALPTGINDDGTIVGQRHGEDDVGWQPVVWQRGAATPLTRGWWNGALVHAVNNKGVIVGESFTTSGFPTHGLVWHNAERTELQNLPNPTGQYSWDSGALGLNDKGQIVGYATVAHEKFPEMNDVISRPQAVTWENGKMTVLDSHLENWKFGYAQRINEAGQIIGVAHRFEPRGTWSVEDRAALWENGELKLLGDEGSIASDITEAGMVVGSNLGDGVLWMADGRTLSLDSLLDGTDAQHWDITSVRYANDVGQYLVAGLFDGQQRYAILTPVPEPESVALLLAGLGLLGARLRRRGRHG